MQQNKIVVTGAAGFIGSCMVQQLNNAGYNNIIIVDNFNQPIKQHNWQNKQYTEKVDRDFFFTWLQQNNTSINAVIHLGAKTDTTEFDYSIHKKLNIDYSENIWNYCVQKSIPLIYASSAATYGAGEFGYNDEHTIVHKLQPLNPYGISKNEFDKWAIAQPVNNTPQSWAGLKFFNVYGPNEYHKARMASVIFHSFNQIKNTAFVKLFKSHKPNFKHGEQLRDFVYVKDVVQVIFWMLQKMINKNWDNGNNGLYNLGTGVARTFYDLAKATFIAQGLQPNIQFIDMPLDIQDKYQYFTEANMAKLKVAGYTNNFYSLEDGVTDYVQNYLVPNKFL